VAVAEPENPAAPCHRALNPPALEQAADVLAELGAAGAAAKLMGMEPAARGSIIESMAPRAAADTLVSMEGVLQVRREGQGSWGPGTLPILASSGRPAAC
jgi:hypothetical protein